MSGLEIAAATIGITDVAIKSIKGLYDKIQEYRDAPEDVQCFRDEITGLQTNLSGLEFLNHANDNTKEQVRKIGLDQYVNSCGGACTQFEAKLAKWTKHDKGKSFRDRMNILRNKTAIQKFTSQVRNTARLVSLAVGILTLEKVTDTEDLIKKVAQFKIATQDEIDANVAQLKKIQEEEEEDEDAELDLEEEGTNLQAFMEKLDAVAEQVRSIKADQTIGNVKTAKDAQAQVGMSEAVADKVRKQKIGDVETGEKGKAQVGIWPGGKGVFD